MKRVTLILSLAVVAVLLLSKEEAKAMTPSQAMAVQAAEQAVAFPGHHHRGYHRGHHHRGYHHRFHGYHRRGYHHRFHGPRHPHVFYRPFYVPRPPVVVYPPRPYMPYYGYPGGIVVRGRGWGFGIGF